MLRAVAFDLWETLITDLPEIAQRQEAARIDGLAAILGESGHASSRDAVAIAHRDTWHHCWSLYWSRDRDVSARGQVCHFLEMLGLDHGSLDEDLIRRCEDAYGRPALDHPPVLVDGALEVVREAKSLGLSVGVVSNTGRTPGWALKLLLGELGLAGSIDSMVFSNEHGECKPLRSIFETMRAEIGCSFDEIVFVGDNLFADVWGAQQCGMRAVHFAPPKRGNAVGDATTDGWELQPYTTVTHLSEIASLLREGCR